MAFTPSWGTGFEMGSIDCIPSWDRSGAVAVDTVQKHTGSYSMKIGNATQWARIPVSGTEFYAGLWVRFSNAWVGAPRLEFVLTDGVALDLRYNVGTGFLDFYINNLLTVSGTINFGIDTWVNIQIYVKIDNAPNGIFQTKIDGIADIAYADDTKPTAATDLSYFRFTGFVNQDAGWVDDIVLGTGGFPGDLRAEGLFPDADTPDEDWTRSAGADSWDLIDEVPPSDADYISSNTDAQRTIVGLTDWTGTNKVPRFVMAWARARKTDAVADQIKIIDQEGGDTNVGPAENILTTVGYYYKVLLDAPDGTVWDDTHVDNLQLGVDSVIV